MSTNPRGTKSKGPAMAKSTPFDGNRKQMKQFLHKINLMILVKKKDFIDEYTKIAYALSYMKKGSTGICLRNFAQARNATNDWAKYTWKETVSFTFVCKKIAANFEEFNKTENARDKLVRLN